MLSTTLYQSSHGPNKVDYIVVNKTSFRSIHVHVLTSTLLEMSVTVCYSHTDLF